LESDETLLSFQYQLILRSENMKFSQTHRIILSTLGIAIALFSAVSSKATDWKSVSANPHTASTAQSEDTPVEEFAQKLKGDGHGGQGRQAVESGPYHLELAVGKEANATHLDLFVQRGDNHQAIPNAKVTAQIQMPNGSQKTLNMKYSASDKNYTAVLPGTSKGIYKVVVLTDINGKKANGRFSFNR
jgi:hypothetical protein